MDDLLDMFGEFEDSSATRGLVDGFDVYVEHVEKTGDNKYVVVVEVVDIVYARNFSEALALAAVKYGSCANIKRH